MAREARAEQRQEGEQLRMQLAAAAEAAERIAQLEEEAAARDAQIDERAALIAKGSGGVPPSPARSLVEGDARRPRAHLLLQLDDARGVVDASAEMGSPAADGGGATPAEHASETGGSERRMHS